MTINSKYKFTYEGLVYDFSDIFVSSNGFYGSPHGELWTWGNNLYGLSGNFNTLEISTPVLQTVGNHTWKQVSVGYRHTSAIKTDGTLWLWGRNNAGQLGNANAGWTNNPDVSVPVTTFIGGTDWKYVNSGSDATAAIKTDGTLWMWGVERMMANLGTTYNSISTPVTTFLGGTDWKTVSCSMSSGDRLHVAAIKTDGTLWMWGDCNHGCFGDGSTTGYYKSTPVTTFIGGSDWKTVSIHSAISSAIKTDGTLWLWGGGGKSSQAQQGVSLYGSTPSIYLSGKWRKISYVSDEALLALSEDGIVWTWGNGANLCLGRTDALRTKITPSTTFVGETNWKTITSGSAEDYYSIGASTSGHGCAIKTDGTLWGWGEASYGRLGNGSTVGGWNQFDLKSVPITTFSGGTNWRQLHVAAQQVAAIKTDGTLWMWGRQQGSLPIATGTQITISTPVTTFSGGTNWQQVSITHLNGVGVKTDGTLWTWGSENGGRVANGQNGWGVISTPVTTFSGGTNWKQCSISSQVVSAIKTDGTLWICGSTANGYCGNTVSVRIILSTPVTTFLGGTDWKQVSSSPFHTAAIKTDGTLWAWGNGNGGSLGNAGVVLVSTPVTTFLGGTDWKQVSCGDRATAAVKTDGTLWMWGASVNGTLGNNVLIPNTLGIESERTFSTPITTFVGGTDWNQVNISSGQFGQTRVIAVKTDGTLWMWGVQLNYELLDPTGTDSEPSPWYGHVWRDVSVSYGCAHGIKPDGTMWSWGGGQRGGSTKLGNARTDASNYSVTPVTTFIGGNDWKEIQAGRSHVVGFKYNLNTTID